MTLRLAFVVLLTLAAGCRVEEDSAPAAVDSTASVAPAPAPTAEPVEQAVMPVLTLGADGLRLVNPETGSARPLAFGTAGETVRGALESMRGPAERSANDECGAGPLTFAGWPDGLSLAFQDSVFVGWSVDGRSEGADVFTTGTGLGIGSPRALLDSAYAVDIQETTLGTEFRSGGLSGLLSGADADARVTTLWAGTSCSFR